MYGDIVKGVESAPTWKWEIIFWKKRFVWKKKTCLGKKLWYQFGEFSETLPKLPKILREFDR